MKPRPALQVRDERFPARSFSESGPGTAMTSAQSTFVEALNASLNDTIVRFRTGKQEISAGKGSGSGTEEFVIRVHHPRFFHHMLAYGNLGLGESFMHGDFEMESGHLHDFLTALLRNRVDERIRTTPRLALKVGWIRLRNLLHRRETCVQRHYDLGDDLFETFLDDTLTYSCGFADTPDDTLETLQFNKLERVCNKLRLGPDMRLLDIGCGFGGLLMFAAERYGVRGKGITISHAHCDRANREIARRGLQDRITVEFREYRNVRDRFERVVSVGMMEHVPHSEYDLYFREIARALLPGGRGLVHTIGCAAAINRHDPFVQKYIFPGSNLPRLSEISGALEKHGLAILDVENIVRHYSYTVLAWLTRFQEKRATLDPVRYDRIFQRMWEYYLSCGIAAARASDAAVYQVLFHNDRAGDIPLKRV